MSLIYDRKAYAKMQSVNRGEWKVRQWNGVDAFDEVLFRECFKNEKCKGKKCKDEGDSYRTNRDVVRMGDNVERFVIGNEETDALSGKAVFESKRVLPFIEDKRRTSNDNVIKEVIVNKKKHIKMKRNVRSNHNNNNNNHNSVRYIITAQIYDNDHDEQMQTKTLPSYNNVNNNTNNSNVTNSRKKVRYYRHTRPLYVQALFDKYSCPSRSSFTSHNPSPLIDRTHKTITHFHAIASTTFLSLFHFSILQALYSHIFPFRARK